MARKPLPHAPAEPATGFLNERGIAKFTGLSVSWIQRDRLTNRFIPHVRVGGRYLYDPWRVREALLRMEQGGAAV